MSRKFTKQYGSDVICEDPTLGKFLAAGTTVPSDAAVGYAPACIFVHLDGAAGTYLYVNEGTRASADFNALPTPSGDHNLIDEVDLNFGTGTDVNLRWDTSDANANEFLIQLPAGTATNVPVIVIGQSIVDVDLGLYNGVVDPRVCLMGVGAVTTGPGIDFRKARGTAAAPTVVTTGDDLGTIRAYGAVAAGEYVQAAEIRFDMAGTIATTRGPGTITFQTATDAAPSVLTTAMTITAAQVVDLPAGDLTVGTTGTTTGKVRMDGATSGTVTLTVGAAAGTWTMQLPAAVGSAGQQLTDAAGDGICTWAAASLGEWKNDLGILDPHEALAAVIKAPTHRFTYKPEVMPPGQWAPKEVMTGVFAEEAPWAMHGERDGLRSGVAFSNINSFGYVRAAVQALYEDLVEVIKALPDEAKAKLKTKLKVA